MKNQENIDKFFAEKLQQYERQPRAAAWEKLQKKLEKQESKVIPLWWKFASAAAVSLLLASGVYWLNTPENRMDDKFVSVEKNNPKVKTGKSFVEIIKPSEEKESLASIQNNEKVIKLETVVGKRTEKVIVPKRTKLEKALTNENEEVILSKNTIPQPISKPVLETNTIVLVVENTQKPIVKPEKETIVLNLIETQSDAVAEATVLDESANRKQSKFNKIWQQLKRAKNGENVDWKEVGFKPQKLLARADAKIENALTNGEETEK